MKKRGCAAGGWINGIGAQISGRGGADRFKGEGGTCLIWPELRFQRQS